MANIFDFLGQYGNYTGGEGMPDYGHRHGGDYGGGTGGADGEGGGRWSSKSGGGGGGNPDAAMQYAMIQPFQGNARGLLEQQLAKGGYTGVMDSSLYAPMSVGYVNGLNGTPQYSGANYMSALRNELDAQGVKPTNGNKDDEDGQNSVRNFFNFGNR